MKVINQEMNFTNVWLTAFADSRMRQTLARFERQALDFGFPADHICVYDENGLDLEFRRRMSDHMQMGSRGYGYWSWKSQIMLQLLARMPQGDVLVYCDAGCHFNKEGLPLFWEYVRTAERDGGLAFQFRMLRNAPDGHPRFFNPVRMWTKGDLLDWFGVRDSPLILSSGQVAANVVFIRNDPKSVELIRSWQEFFLERLHLLDDTPSVSDNVPGFKESRHDQSVFTLLWLQANMPTRSYCEIEPCDVDCGGSWETMRRYPIWAKRDRGQIRRSPLLKLCQNLFARVSSVFILDKSSRHAYRERMSYKETFLPGCNG